MRAIGSETPPRASGDGGNCVRSGNLFKEKANRADRKNAKRVEYEIERGQVQRPMFGGILRLVTLDFRDE